MVDPAAVRRRLRRLDEIVQGLRELGARPREAFLADRIAQAAAERLLQTAIQIVLDIGAHLLSERGVVDWEEYRDIPGRLRQLGVVPAALAERLERAAGQRNILVHMYLDVDPGLVYETLTRDLDVFETFSRCALAAVEEK